MRNPEEPKLPRTPSFENLKTQRDRRKDDAVRDKTEITAEFSRDRIPASRQSPTTKTVVLEPELLVQEVPDPNAHDTEPLRQTIAQPHVDKHEAITIIVLNGPAISCRT